MTKTAAQLGYRFKHWVFELDRILRGEATQPAHLHDSDFKYPVAGVSVVVILMAVVYGFCMGIFALVRGAENSEYQQALLQTFASMCKVPLLFFLTLLVTFPSLYVFNALVGSKLKVLPVLRLLVASLAVNLAVLASMGPILAFFSVSTPNYHFIVLLNVSVFGVAGVLGLIFLVQTLNRMVVSKRKPQTESNVSGLQQPVVILENDDQSDSENVPSTVQPKTGPLDRIEGVVLGRHVKKVFACWIVVFGLVGAQMGWVLRPFIGSPDQPFQWFRARHSNFFEAVLNTFWEFLF